MTRAEKQEAINILTEKIKDNPIFYLVNIEGLNSVETFALRKRCFKQNIEINVVKNTFLEKAMDSVEAEKYKELKDVLKGNTSIMFSGTGNAPAKLIKEYRKKSDKPILKGAYINDEIYIGDEQLEMLSMLKSKEELIGDVILLLQSPAKNVINSLQSGKNKLAGIVKTLSERAS